MHSNQMEIQEQLNKIWNGWKIDKLLGEGAYGKVYRIFREDFGHTYEAALKIITIPKSQSEITSIMSDGMDEKSVTAYFHGIVEDIVEEFALMSKVKGNTNIVSYEDHAVIPFKDGIGWNIYIKMELLTPLYTYLKEHDMSVIDVIHLGIDMCQALEVCHRYNIIHRDIKPENIFISDLGRYKLGDFGIARQLENTNVGLSRKGTYVYMAPDVYKGEDYDLTVDIYSLGIVLYKFLNNNRAPFLPLYPQPLKYSDSEQAIIMRMSGKKIPYPCNASKMLAEIVLKACAYNPRDRYQNVSDMKRNLQEVLQKEKKNKTIFSIDNFRSISNVSKEPNKEDSQYDISDMQETVVLGMKKQSDFEEAETVILNKNKEKQTTTVKKNNKQTIIGIVAGVVIVMIVLVVMSGMNSSITAPNICNKTVEEAEKTVKVKEIGTEYSNEIEKGFIISQDKYPGERIKRNEQIGVIVSAGKMVIVPQFVGVNYEDALSSARVSNLKLNISENRYSDTVSKGKIIEQSIQPDEYVGEQSIISIVVSKGRKLVTVPNVVGLQEDKAKGKMKKAGLKYSIVKEYSDDVSEGKVIRQNVKSSEKVTPKSKIELIVSRGVREEVTKHNAEVSRTEQYYSEPKARNNTTRSGTPNSDDKNKTKKKTKEENLNSWDLIN